MAPGRPSSSGSPTESKCAHRDTPNWGETRGTLREGASVTSSLAHVIFSAILCHRYPHFTDDETRSKNERASSWLKSYNH